MAFQTFVLMQLHHEKVADLPEDILDLGIRPLDARNRLGPPGQPQPK
jgi:hypothetical protein